MAILDPPFSILDCGGATMKIEILPDADTVAREAAKFIAAEAR